ncbi:MAG: hypothetical protein V7784_24120 [Oceanospirillaceae bacterium]
MSGKRYPEEFKIKAVILGHSDHRTTERYAHLATSTLITASDVASDYFKEITGGD